VIRGPARAAVLAAALLATAGAGAQSGAMGGEDDAGPELFEVGPGWTRPRAGPEGCPARTVRVPGWTATHRGSFTARFAVGPDGLVYRLSIGPPAPREVAAAVREAVERCDWSPGADPLGRLATVWVTIALDVGE
jgi:hypothetical protein